MTAARGLGLDNDFAIVYEVLGRLAGMPEAGRLTATGVAPRRSSASSR